MCGQGLNRMDELITKLSVLVFLTVSLANPIYELWVVASVTRLGDLLDLW